MLFGNVNQYIVCRYTVTINPVGHWDVLNKHVTRCCKTESIKLTRDFVRWELYKVIE